ncbi:MAG: helix-turn-helix transcriptional regulator [Caulobacteraceae bacterium]|nr:helix-turn-helix transcriptional regulator [Caulobacteraceae bacterium]
MPLDTGAIAEGLDSSTAARLAAERGPPPTLSSPDSLGQILRAMRLYRGLDLDDLSQVTRIRVNYLAAIEHMRVDQLPSRPFALGYVRTYAQALGLDGDLAAARFKVEAPDGAEPLRAPLGVRRETDPRLKLLGGAGVLVTVAIFAWNIAQHLPGHHVLAPKTVERRAGAEVAASAARPRVASVAGPLTLGAPLPAPAESTTPQPYITPGLEQQLGPSAAEAAAQQSAAARADPVGSPFTPKGAVYGVPPAQSNVILQARKGAALVVHGADGSVYFARELAAGEAYRAPLIKGLTIDVSDPDKFEVYVGGALKGPLTSPKTETSTLAASASAG